MLDQVLEALATMADRLGRAIQYSNRYWNDTNSGDWHTVDEAMEMQRAAVVDHETWYDEYEAARWSLQKLGFPDEESWSEPYFTFPQIAYTQCPERFGTAGPLDGVTIIGAGGFANDIAIPSGLRVVGAGEVLPSTQTPGAKRVAGLFDDQAVRNWERVLEDIEGAVRRVSETLFVMKSSLGGVDAERIGELIAEATAARKARQEHAEVSSPNDPRDEWMYQQKADGKTHGEIAADLARLHPEWEQIEDESGIGKAIGRYCTRKNKPTIRRKQQQN